MATVYYVLSASGSVESVSRAPVNVDDVVSRGGSVVESATFVGDIDLLETVAPDGEPVYKAEQAPAAVVPVVSMMQCQLALLAVGKLDEVEAAIAQADRAVQISWRTASIVRRDNPIIELVSASVGLSSAEVDALFEQAAQL
jgi:hypothetical protein